MTLDLSTRLGLMGAILALFSIAAFYLWPDKKWIGWMCLLVFSTLATAWIVIETKQAIKNQTTSLLISVAVGCLVGGTIAGLSWRSFRKSVTPTEIAGVQLSITCNVVALPMAYRGEIWILDTFMSGSLGKFTAPPTKESLWPESGVYGAGYVCTVKNYGTQPAFGVSLSLEVTKHSWVQLGPTSWGAGDPQGTRTIVILLPWPLGQEGRDDFSFYVCSYDTESSPSVRMPSVAFINSQSQLERREVPLRIASPENPITVTAKLMRDAPKTTKRRK